MSAQTKFQIKGPTLIVTAPFELDDRQAEEEGFLQAVDRLLDQRSKALTIDLVHAGGLSSTAIALTIAAHRKAGAKGKSLSLRVAKRNAMAVRVSGLTKLLDVELI